jgi:hypothetical protein
MRTLFEKFGSLLLAPMVLAVLVSTRPALAAPSPTSPATATAASKVTFQVTGSGNPRDFVTIVPKGTPEGQYRDYFYLENREKVLDVPATPGEVINAQGQVLASGIVGGDALTVPAGDHQVRIKGRANSAKPVTVKPKETATVAY